MAARRKTSSPQQAKQQASKQENAAKDVKPSTTCTSSLAEAHLPPLTLVCVVLLCSGFLLMLALRDFMTTGRNILGPVDEAFLLYSKSTDWYDDSRGWKSTQGGFSAIRAVSTDANNMGGFFVRKCAGAAALGWQMIKLWPLLVHTSGMEWQKGHYRPWLATAALGNLAIAVFSLSYLPQWQAEAIPNQVSMVHWACMNMAVLFLEATVLVYYLVTCPVVKGGPTQAFQDGKNPRSLPSNVVSRTIVLVTGAMMLCALRDLFAPGVILEFWPRDDVYLEWTNALRHSPPVGSPEWHAGALDAPLYVGDKFISQLMAVYLVVTCVAKLVSALAIRLGPDGGRGTYQAKLLWQGTCLANAALMVVLRLFTPAAASASWDLRYHLMAVGYETFILGLYGFF